MKPLAALLKSARSTNIRFEIWMLFAWRRYANFLPVQKWEIGEKRPSGPSLKLLNVIERKDVKALA